MNEKTIWTAYCSFPESPRGQYDEELDIEANWRASPTRIKAKAMAIIARDYDPRLTVRKVVRQGPGWFF